MQFKVMGHDQDLVMYDTLLTSDTYRRLLLVSDFCHAGNYYQLRYYLCLTGEPEWKESRYWNGETPASRAIHFASADRHELAGEGDKSGGFFTNIFAKTWGEPLALPDRLLRIRTEVSNWTRSAIDRRQLPLGTTQTPQVFSSFKADLKDPDVLKKFQVGDLVEVE
ncbi:hypothetical protein FRC07_006215 [Ceratobasidium sp. 392]|nr:hypothetical protein FRC07_006215 [Ceratobasidium sp. 392]